MYIAKELVTCKEVLAIFLGVHFQIRELYVGAEGHLIENFHLMPTLPYTPVFQFLTPDRKV